DNFPYIILLKYLIINSTAIIAIVPANDKFSLTLNLRRVLNLSISRLTNNHYR
ncbi:hypothetical protein Q604_UNBC10181G0001, partial [human gut metagenome]